MRLANWEYIQKCAKVCQVPFLGNGDIYSYEDALKHIEGPVSSVMLARGAIIKPWLFQEIKERRHIDISATERFDMMKKFVDYGLIHWGSDQRGVDTTRYFLMNWMSFLHRYTPVALLGE